ncbi:flagellar export chaperone FliS [Simiduia agarivorans]|uniref:Flagellar secretion chaperone FliS n=1 Tax=Simiduia agarivorans (strain DSM 21679 / JCM 13881 / BCRC 17597 / SA1) TaxID=1117647 RepID=K4KFH8_SIMAS|nr:flagellar export chaperone FliS [Simiduia agarivorans]AFU97676.1 flagellar protein FliS [Simiduia agarivorans SA1 = DSM 21679]
MIGRSNINAYTKVKNETSVESADAHRLIELLYDGALERIAQAKGAQTQGRIDIRGAKISHAVNIVMGLRDALDPDQGKDIADNLDALYDYIQRLLLSAHRESSLEKLDEAAGLLTQLSATWKEISPTH